MCGVCADENGVLVGEDTDVEGVAVELEGLLQAELAFGVDDVAQEEGDSVRILAMAVISVDADVLLTLPKQRASVRCDCAAPLRSTFPQARYRRPKTSRPLALPTLQLSA